MTEQEHPHPDAYKLLMKGNVSLLGHCEALEAENKRLREALEEGRRAIGDHDAPTYCYATGPLTGDSYRDLVECPACSFISMYEAVTAKIKGSEAKAALKGDI